MGSGLCHTNDTFPRDFMVTGSASRPILGLRSGLGAGWGRLPLDSQMKPPKIKERRPAATTRAMAVATLLGLFAGASACTGKIGALGTMPGGGPGAGAGTGAGLSGGTGAGLAGGGTPTGTGSTGGGGTGGDPLLACQSGVPAARMPMKRLTAAQYAKAVTDIFNGRITPSDKFPDQSGHSVTGFSTEPDSNSVDDFASEQILYAAEDAALQVPTALPQLVSCASTGGASCADTFIKTYGKRAYRRPLQADEIASLTTVFTDSQTAGMTFAEAIAVVVDVMLQSPQFLYIPEIGVGTGADRALTPHEVATRLSFLLWDSGPDDMLLAAADGNALSSPAQIEAQARRLLMSDKASASLQRFFREWTRVQTLSRTSKDQTLFPQYTDALAQAMDESFNRFVVSSARTGTVAGLLTSNKTMVNATMATYLGVSMPSGTPSGQWAEVTMDANRYSGIATHPAVLANLAHFGDTSYVFRGRFVLKGLMCETLGEAPADAQVVASQLTFPANSSSRQRSDIIRGAGACGTCHGYLDPLGLAFENFDATGRWRDKDQFGKAIDTAGALAPYGLQFSGASELMTQLSQAEAFRACFGKQWYRFFTARMEATDDTCMLNELDKAAQVSDGSISEILVALTKSYAFSHRKFSEAP